jgi:nitrate reductase NapE component
MNHDEVKAWLTFALIAISAFAVLSVLAVSQ